MLEYELLHPQQNLTLWGKLKSLVEIQEYERYLRVMRMDWQAGPPLVVDDPFLEPSTTYQNSHQVRILVIQIWCNLVQHLE